MCYKKTGKIYAIKEMSKAKIIDKNSVDSILGEKKILSEIYHPFIVNMIYSFQDSDYLYLVMELISGGNLRYNLTINKTFEENQIKFIIGCIMTGLKYIHSKNILHRDIKPENLVFDSRGYLRITDFGIAKHYVINNKKDTSGTIGYLAPEVLCNVNHNFSIDYYAVGIITFELIFGHRPYIGKNKHEVKQLILTKQAKVDYDDLPEGFSNNIADFINKLIQRKPKNRLGKNNIDEVLNHTWFGDFDWDNCAKKNLRAPYIPKFGDNFDKNYCLKSYKIGTETMQRYEKIMEKDDINTIFKDFNCNKIPAELKGFSTKKNNENKIVNNNISSNISTTSISKNNKIENIQKNKAILNNIIEINKNLIQNKLDNNNVSNLGIKNNHNKSKENIDNINKEVKNNNNLKISTKKQNINLNIINSQRNVANNKEKEENEFIIKNSLKNKSISKKKMNRNISAKNIYRNRYNLFYNSSQGSKIDLNLNLGIIKSKRQSEITSYRCKKENNLNQNPKLNRASSNIYYNSQSNKKLFLQNKKDTNIVIPRTKKDFIKKELLKNNSLIYSLNKNQNEINFNFEKKNIPSIFMSSTFYPKKNNNKIFNHSRMSSKRLMQNNSLNNLNENKYLKEEDIKKKVKNNFIENINLSRKNIMNNNDKKLPFLSLSISKIKKNKIEPNSGKNDIFFKFNQKNNNKTSRGNNKIKNGLNYDFLSERIK